MKLSGLLGTGSGKMGTAVFSTVAGQQIVRQYQPNVANPSTDLQVDQRAKLKLASQIAADVAPVIAIPRVGASSARNQFVKKNFASISAADGTAKVAFAQLQFTAGSAMMPQFSVTRASNAITLVLLAAAPADITNVMYMAFRIDESGRLQYMESVNVSRDAAGTFSGSLSGQYPTSSEYVFYAYGVKVREGAASAKFANYHIATASDFAVLISRSRIGVADAPTTQTAGALLPIGSDSSQSLLPNQFAVPVTVVDETSGQVIANSGVYITPNVLSVGGSFSVHEGAYTLRSVAYTIDGSVITGERDPETSERLYTVDERARDGITLTVNDSGD